MLVPGASPGGERGCFYPAHRTKPGTFSRPHLALPTCIAEWERSRPLPAPSLQQGAKWDDISQLLVTASAPALRCFSLHLDPVGLCWESLALPQIPKSTFIPGPIETIWTALDPDQHLWGGSLSPRGRGGKRQLWEGGGEGAALGDSVNPSHMSLFLSNASSPTSQECHQAQPMRAGSAPPTPCPGKTPTLRPAFGVGDMPPCRGRGGAWLAQDPGPGWSAACPQPRASWPRFRPSAPLGGQPPSGCLFQVRSPPKPPPLLVPLQALHKSSPTPPHSPQPTSRSPRGTWPVPFMSPLRGHLPFHCRRQLLVRRPLKHGCGPACWPPLQGGQGGTSRGKGQLCHLP